MGESWAGEHGWGKENRREKDKYTGEEGKGKKMTLNVDWGRWEGWGWSKEKW